MRELVQAIPDVVVLLALEPEELAAKLLFLIRKRISASPHMVILSNLIGELRGGYPDEKLDQAVLAMTEAWLWLEVQCLLIPAPSQVGNATWRVLSRRARKFENEEDFASLAAARLLPAEVLHPAMRKVVWQAFMRGEFDTAVFQAMRAVEIAVRDAAGFAAGDHGLTMIRNAFQKGKGQLSKPSDDEGEQEALSHLFAGAYGRYRNPHSHRKVELDDPREAIEIIMLANHLLRIVEERRNMRAALNSNSGGISGGQPT